jgi:uncharacterized repeat protein (TIGR01451 family)
MAMVAGLIAIPIAVLPVRGATPTATAPVSAGTPRPATPTATAPVSAGTPRPATSAKSPAGTPRPAASAKSPAVPGLSISVSDGHIAAKTGDRLAYTVSVRDSGTAAAPHLKITQTLSAGLVFLSASRHGVATAGQVAWDATIPAGGTETFNVVARVAQTPARLLRLAAVACAAPAGSSRPIVCASHLDRLPVAAAAPATRAGGFLLPYAAAGLGALAVGVLAVIAGQRVRLRRLRARP